MSGIKIAPLDYRTAAGAPAGIGDNQPPVDWAVSAKPVVDLLIANTEAWAEDCPVITNEEAAATCEDKLKQLNDHRKEIDDKRKAEKAEHDRAIATIQAKANPLLERLRICIEAISGIRDAWLRLKQQRLDDERAQKRREADEAARRAQRLAEAAQAKTTGPGAVTNQIAATEAAAEAKKAAKIAAAVPVRAQQRGTLGGRASSLRTFWFAEVVDWQKCFEHFHEADSQDPERKRMIPVESLRKELTRLANEQVRLGVRNPNLPGCWIDSEMR